MTMTSPTTLPHDELSTFARKLRAIGEDARSNLGKHDERYILSRIRLVQSLDLSGRILLFLGFMPIFWLLGVILLAAAKIIENTEIAHNVMHGQYDWLGHPRLNGELYEMDSVATSEGWRRSHNGPHHQHTGITGLDEDLGILRLDNKTPWKPYHLAQPLLAVIAALFAQWAVATQGFRFKPLKQGEIRRFLKENRWPIRKITRQMAKDYLIFPLLAGPNFLIVLSGNLVANGLRNVWVWLVIICGHCTDNVDRYPPEVLTTEPPEHWYLRQVRGAANLTGNRFFHLMSGHLGYHIEHHLYPDIPSRHYPNLARQVQAVCTEHHVPYNSLPFLSQALKVIRRILLFSLPGKSATAG